MTVLQPPVLELPAMLRGYRGAIRRDLRVQGQGWAREYLKTGGFTQPQRMLQVVPGEVLVMRSGVDSNVIPRPRWRIHMFSNVFMSLDDGVPREERSRMEEAFESFCLDTPWGALHHAVSPPPPHDAGRMARRFAALLRFWDPLQGPRYGYIPSTPRTFAEVIEPRALSTLEELMKYIHGMTLEAWSPGGPASVREHLALTVERMARATREDCLEAVLRMIPALIEVDTHLKHREELRDPGFLHERLATLAPEDLEKLSGTDRYTLSVQLDDWDRELGRH